MKYLLLIFALLIPSILLADPSCEDKGKLYPICSDQKSAFEKLAAKAVEEKKMVLTVFGADWCPWCHSLHRVLHGAEKNEYLLSEIGLYRARDKVPSGEKVMQELLGHSSLKEAPKGVPVMALYNPKTKKAVFIDTEPLE